MKKTKLADVYLKFLVDIIRPFYKEALQTQMLSVSDALENYFCTDEREIYFITFTEVVKNLEGKQWKGGSAWSDKGGPRYVAAGQTGLVRFDKTRTERFDLQLHLDGEHEIFFALTRAQWDSIKDKVVVEYTSKLTGKDPVHARRLKRYHEDFVGNVLQCRFNFRTSSGALCPGYRDRVRGK